MKNSFLSFLSLLLLCTLSSGQNFKRTPPPVQLDDGDTFVFIGNSITHQCLYTQYVEDYYYTRYPNKRIHFHNAGVSGDVAADVIRRFGEDVAVYKPKYASVLIGMNDGRYKRMDENILEDYTEGMLGIVDSLQSIGTAPILITPTMFDLRPALAGNTEFDPDYAESIYYNSTLAYFGTWVLQIANGKGLGYINMFEPLNRITRDQRKNNPQFTLIEDAVHPGPDGQVVMALAFLKDIGADPLVSFIHIDTKGAKREAVEVMGGKFRLYNTDILGFEFTPEGLPWVLPEDAAFGYENTNAGSAMSREVIRVTGLSKGDYDLLINGREVGQYSHLDFAKGVELQENKMTPQYKQAAKIAELNKQRNEEAVKPMRDLWLTKKIINAYHENPEEFENEEGKKWFENYLMEHLGSTDLDNFNKQFDSKLIPLIESAKVMEDKIYEINKPDANTYQIIKK